MPESAPGDSPATAFSVALLGEFARLGVRDVVLCPGSRSQALALACAELERIGRIRLHVRLDERGAGFLALGMAVETGVPALVITTSGTAVANLHPAVLEAHHSGVPMILITADRPDELRGIGSNQTTAQPGLFGGAVRLSVDEPAPVGGAGERRGAIALARRALGAATGITATGITATGVTSTGVTATGITSAGIRPAGPGPVQLNLAFREPLSSAVTLTGDEPPAEVDPPASAPPASDRPEADRPASARPLVVAAGPRTVVIAGHAAGPAAEEFARAGGWPLLAEVSSGARYGPTLVAAYRELLRDPDFGGRVERAIVFGHPTLSREIPALLQRGDVQAIVVATPGAERYNPGHRVAHFAAAARPDEAAAAAAATPEAREWLGRWVMTSRQILAADPALAAAPIDQRGISRAELAVMRAPVTRPMLVDALWRASWPHDRLVLGASRLIREADSRVPGKKISVHANRGLAGIDGTVATAIGIALAGQAGPDPRSTGTTRLLLGDLALLHDAGSLLLAPGEPLPRLQVIVGNDGGGSIFDGLEVAASAPAAALDRVLFTPQRVDLSALASAYGWEYSRAATRSELERALTGPPLGPSILEVPLAR